MFDRLDQMEARYEELGNQLAIPLQRTFSAGTRVRF